jgi:hypothetical protein
MPVLIWGDAFPDGGRPQVRRALAGADAHNCMYAWVYLTELIAVRALLAAPMPDGEPMARFRHLKSVAPDPHAQISDELPEVFLPVARLMNESSEFVELGPTLFGSIEKLDLAFRLLSKTVDARKILFSGIEYSSFMHQAGRSLHPGANIQLVKESHEWSRSRDLAVHVSRFVGSYAFRSTEVFAAELARCDAFHVIDVFSLTDEFQSWDLGLPITFFDVERLAAALPGHDVYLGRATPEYHWTLRRKAMSLRLFGVRKGLARHDEPLLERGLGQRVDGSLTADQWDAFAEQKKHFPIWGGPAPFDKSTLTPTMDLHFSEGELSQAERRTNWP